MCDTFVALPEFAANQATLFAKNSDRERNEAQGLEIHRAARHEAGSALRLTYVTIPQVASTRACLISRPFWMWGAEMGSNDAGVTIGNEAVHSTVAPRRGKALIGMDLVRLGLERGGSAAEAIDIMVALLERHGQGGDCGHLEPFHYHNSFIIADASEAFVLETVGRWWAVEAVTGSRAISNVLSIGRGAGRVSTDLMSYAQQRGWCGDDGRFEFAGRLYDPDKDVATRGAERCARASALLEAAAGSLRVADAMRILRDHGSTAVVNSDWSPADIVGRTICMHAGGGDRRSQTVSSLVSETCAGGGLLWVTASSGPCLSVFKPVTLAFGLPPQGPAPADCYDSRSRWWRAEILHRNALVGYVGFMADFAPARDRLEAGFRAMVDDTRRRDAGPLALERVLDTCWREADAFEEHWARRAGAKHESGGTGTYEASWAAFNRLAEMPTDPHATGNNVRG